MDWEWRWKEPRRHVRMASTPRPDVFLFVSDSHIHGEVKWSVCWRVKTDVLASGMCSGPGNIGRAKRSAEEWYAHAEEDGSLEHKLSEHRVAHSGCASVSNASPPKEWNRRQRLIEQSHPDGAA